MTQPDPAGASRSRELEALNEIARTATLDLELRPMLQRITDTLLQKFGWPFVALASVDAEQEVFVCEALSTLLPSAVQVGYTRKLGTGFRVTAELVPTVAVAVPEPVVVKYA